MPAIVVNGRKARLISGGSLAPAPDNFQSLVLGDAVELTWDSVPAATSYKLYRNTVNNPATATLINNANVLEYLDLARSQSTTYYYWVAAVRSGTDGTKAMISATTGAFRTDVLPPGTLLSPTSLWNPSGEDLMTRFSLNPGDVIVLEPGYYSTLDFNGYFDDITVMSSSTGVVNITGRVNFGAEGQHHKLIGNLSTNKNIRISSGLGGYFASSSRASGYIYYRNLNIEDNFMGLQVEHRDSSDPEYPSYLLNYQELVIRDVNIDGTGQEGMYIGSNIISDHQIFGTITDCTVSNCGRDGIQCRNGLFRIEGNTIATVGTNGEDAHGHGILYGGGGGSTDINEKTWILNNTVTGAAVFGLFSNGYGYVWVEGNSFSGGTLTSPFQANFSGMFMKNYESNTEDINGVGFQHITLKDNSFTTANGNYAIDIRRDPAKCPVTVDYYQSSHTLSPNTVYIEDGVRGAANGITTNILS